MTLIDKYTMDPLFVESWDRAHDNMEEYKVLFEAENDTCYRVS